MSGLEINSTSTVQPTQTRQPVLVTAKGKKIFEEALNKAEANNKLDAGFNKLMKYTRIEGYSSSDEKKIRNTLKEIYYGSEKARELYDHIGNQKTISKGDMKAELNSKGETIFEIKHPSLKGKGCVDDQAEILKTTIFISPKNEFGHYFMNSDGKDILNSLERSIVHESNHAIGWTLDNDNPPFDLEGDTVRATNVIMKQLGSKDERAAYQLGTGSVKPWKPDGCS